ncbi:MAG: phasin family protein [Pseudomonadota bacterium]
MTQRQRKTDAQASAGPAAAFGVDVPLMVGTAAMQAWMQIGAEAVRFVASRLQQDLKTQKAMMACTSLEEMQALQAEFFRTAQDQYAAEARRMMEMAGKAATAGVTPAAHSGQRKYDDVPL